MDTINFFIHFPDLFLLVVGALGLLIGSFLNVVVYRLPRMIEQEWSQECREYLGLKPSPTETKPVNLWLPCSHCPSCKAALKPWHNIPVISYLFLQGKCAYCNARIAARYPFVEILTCVASVYVAWRFGVSWQTTAALIFTWILIALTFIDLDFHLLPDSLTFLLLGTGLFCSLFSIFCTSQDAIIGAIAGFLIFAIIQWLFKLITGKTGMGQGDFKFLAALGGFLGWQMLPIIILFSSVCGLIFGLAYMIVKHQFKSVPLPFGPYLALAGWISMIWGTEILHVYLKLLY